MTVTFSQTLGSLYGDLVDVDVLEQISKLDDPSSVHVPGLLKVARRKRPVEKGFSDLVAGHLGSMRRIVGVHSSAPVGRHAVIPPGVGRHAAPRGSKKAKVVMAPRPTPKAPGNPNVPAVSTTDKVRNARAGTDRLLSTTEGKVAVGGGLGAAGLAEHERNRANSSGYDVYKLDDRTKRQLTAGASAVGAAAGLIGTAAGVKAVRANGLKALKDVPNPGVRRIAREGWRNSSRLERGLLTVEPVGLAGEVGATTILHGDTKRQQVGKGDGSFEIAGAFSKFDDDKKRAYGWASVVELEGVPVIDRQGDVIDLEDLEEAAYVYVRKSRVTGDMHRRTHDDQPHRVGELIESVVFTPDKCEAMGVSKSLAGKWWMGVQIEDEGAWDLVKKGERTGFSIHGKGIRKATTVDDVMYAR